MPSRREFVNGFGRYGLCRRAKISFLSGGRFSAPNHTGNERCNLGDPTRDRPLSRWGAQLVEWRPNQPQPGIPVVFVSVGAPVDIGLVETLARPGSNMTGTTFEATSETYAKRVQLLKEILPNLSRVAVLGAMDEPELSICDAVAHTICPGSACLDHANPIQLC